MPEIWFYHLQHQPLEKALPSLLEKALERGWRVVVQAAADERLDALDDLLWTYAEASFLAHGRARDGDAEMQPVYLTTGPENPNGARLRLFIEGADVEALVASGSLRSLRTPHPALRWRRRRSALLRARAVESVEGAGPHARLLAAGRTRRLGRNAREPRSRVARISGAAGRGAQGARCDRSGKARRRSPIRCAAIGSKPSTNAPRRIPPACPGPIFPRIR